MNYILSEWSDCVGNLMWQVIVFINNNNNNNGQHLGNINDKYG